MGVDINDVDSAGGSLSSLRGDQGSGQTLNPGLLVDFAVQSTDVVTLWITMVNGPTDPSSIAELDSQRVSLDLNNLSGWVIPVISGTAVISVVNYLATTVLSSIGNLLGLPNDLLKYVLPQNVLNALFPNCDGWVALVQKKYTGQQLYQLISTTGSIVFANEAYNGYDSNGRSAESICTDLVRWMWCQFFVYFELSCPFKR